MVTGIGGPMEVEEIGAGVGGIGASEINGFAHQMIGMATMNYADWWWWT